jgi:hypothetical protein
MASMIVRHTVRDYHEWRPVFDAHEGARQAAGLTNAKVYCSTDDPNDLLLCSRSRIGNERKPSALPRT